MPRVGVAWRMGVGSSNLFFFQAEDGIRDLTVTGVQTCALPILSRRVIAGSFSTTVSPTLLPTSVRPIGDRKNGENGKSGDLGGRRIIKKKAFRWIRLAAHLIRKFPLEQILLLMPILTHVAV